MAATVQAQAEASREAQKAGIAHVKATKTRIGVRPVVACGVLREFLSRIVHRLGERADVPGELLLGTPGYTFGLGFAVRQGDGIAGVPGSAGEFMWAGYAGTFFWVDPQEELVGVYMTQARAQYAPITARCSRRSSIRRLWTEASPCLPSHSECAATSAQSPAGPPSKFYAPIVARKMSASPCARQRLGPLQVSRGNCQISALAQTRKSRSFPKFGT